MFEEIIEMDRFLFEQIHFGMSSPFLDSIAPWIREKLTWIPLYGFFIYWLIKHLGFKKGLFSMLMLIVTVVITDFISSQVVKQIVGRLRPCRLDNFVQQIYELVTCGQGYSFPSSHAANHFAIAWFLICSQTFVTGWQASLLILWAALISFAQIYVGVHYPLDILGGALIGTLIAYLISTMLKRWAI